MRTPNCGWIARWEYRRKSSLTGTPQQIVGEAKSGKSEDMYSPRTEGSTTRSTRRGEGGSDGRCFIHAEDLFQQDVCNQNVKVKS